MSFENVNFRTNPNFKFKEIVREKSECLSGSYQFDCYQDDDKSVYLLAPYWDIDNPQNPIHHISKINLSTGEEVKLEGHKDRVLCTRYFQDPYTKKHYLISCDRKYKVIVWDLSNNNGKIFEEEKETLYDCFIYSVLIFFEEKKKYAVVSTLSTGETKIFDIDERRKVKELKDTKDLNIYFLTYWYDKANSQHNIIQCGKNLILISQYPSDTNYSFKIDEKYPYNLAAMVYTLDDKDLLITSATYGLIQIIDLKAKAKIKEIQLKDVFIYSFVKWNDDYILVNDCLQKSILVLEPKDDYKIKSRVLCPTMYFDRFIKKVDHPKYGESILSVGVDWRIKLFINRNLKTTDNNE